MTNYSNLIQKGYDYYNNKNFNKAVSVCQEILVKRYKIEALILAGMANFKLNKYNQSEFYLNKAFKERPEDEIVTIHLIESFIKNKKFEEGLIIIKTIQNKNKRLLLLEIKLLQYIGEFKEVIQKVYVLPDSVIKYELLAWNYELLNQLSKAKKYAKKGIKIHKGNFKCNIVLSKINLRKYKIKKANKYLKNINSKIEPFTNQSIFFSQKAQILVKQNKYKKAFKYFTKSNQKLKYTTGFKKLEGNSNYSLNKLRLIKEYFIKAIKFEPIIACDIPVTFMVGFPRSGTTLLENILNAHSKVISIEEKPIVDEILQIFLDNPEDITKLDKLNINELKQLQQMYIKKRNLYGKSNNAVIIDKMPLNLIHMGILYRIFPNAKFIISHRDLRDVALSCYFQSFELNDAMVNFLDWDKTMTYLIELMSLGLVLLNNYPIKHIFVEYEKLVETPYKNVREIIKFLDLQWEDSIKSYRKQIKGKAVNTPSYAKISEKINTKQKQKWKNYKFCFKKKIIKKQNLNRFYEVVHQMQ